MSVSDILSGIGNGLAKAGAVASPILERTAQVESGEAPQIDAEQRQRQTALEDAAIETKASALEQQLQMGQKYGTLTPDQQQQYVDQITGLYSHPRHAGKLMEKLRQAIHPNGAFAQGPQAPLPNATPPGGTAAVDEQNRGKALADAIGLRQTATDEEIDRRAQDAAKYHKPAGKSPPTPGNQLPEDAIGPDGQPISSTDRTAGKSFIEWNGAWYAAPKAKPIYRIIKGNVALMDPATGLPMRDLGPASGVKLSTHQTPFMGDDGQMHLLSTTSVTTPQGESIDVEAPPPEESSSPAAATSQSSSSSSKPKTPAKKVSPGSLLPKTGAKTPGMGPAIPGSHNWANSKDPLFRADVASYKKVKDDAEATHEAFQSAQSAIKNPSPTSDQELIYSWVRSNVQGAGRMTQAEFRQAASVGSLPQRAQNWYSMASSGKLTPEIRNMMFADIKRSDETKSGEAERLRNGLGGQQAPSGDAPKVLKFNPATGKLE